MSEWNYELFWDEIISQFKNELQEASFSMFFAVIRYKASTKTSIIIEVPSQFIKIQIMQRYQADIERKLLEISGQKLLVEFEVSTVPITNSQNEPEEDTHSLNTKTIVKPAPKKNESRGAHPSLNEDYNFDDFIVGPNNNFAVNAALAITKNPGTSYNPFLIYGGVGLGKTHLMQAIGNDIWKNTKLKVIYVTAENFTNEFVECVQKKAMPSFKSKYRTADILLIDDIHFFQGKAETQEELFHTFNELYERNKQIVFTCDRPPSELKNLSKRLQSRFERGLNVDLQTPGFETRCAILLKKLEKRSVKIPEKVVQMVAKNVSSNVRDLEAALTKLIAYAELTKKEITEALAQNLLRDFFGSTRQRNVSVDIIQKTVADYFRISISDIKGKKRTKSFAYPRQIAMYLCRKMTECSTTELGNEFGGRDHTTILHGCNKVEDLMRADPGTEATIHELQKQIKENINK
ncbi:chromosomal replication initiator protein DnaA [Treponema pedis]|uniref:Chromosomal replication initiator protein DnaA n=1 Tax=Treponema pedis str. T A4 TaxID=1291379 RepID=S6A7Q6_9SPIR|nr:chromosomal replication initiator protein DnaA [Treponema pedis]AGT42504.1 chromosomal replication initiation protein [Treponema pedis str. T A4]